MGRRRSLRAALAAGAALTLAQAACAPALAPVPVERPVPRIEAPAPVAGDRSRAVAAYYAQVEADLRARGLLRTDGGGRDAPFGPRQLVETFVRVALYDEYARDGGQLVPRATPAALRRWSGPVRIGVRFGASVPADQRARDTAAVAAYAARLAQATGHPVRLTDSAANFWVYVVAEDERRALVPEWAGLFSGVSQGDLAFAGGIDPGTFCLVLAISEGDSPVYSGALAIVRAELPDLLRLSCFHEELAQGMGLANDSPLARPSVFNDDEEFALLTPMDALLLRMLYDPRLRPGMREPEARPIAEVIAAELAPGGS